MQKKFSIEGINIVASKGIKVWQMRTMLLFMFLMLMTGTLLVPMPLFSLVLGFSSLILLMILNLFFLPRLYNRLSVICQNNCITVFKGYYNQRKMRIRFSSIEYLILSEGVIEKFYGVCTVYVLMAGHTAALWEISVENALELERMVRYYQENQDEANYTEEDDRQPEIPDDDNSQPVLPDDKNRQPVLPDDQNSQPVLHGDERYGR